jgi:hypothetical protein
MVRILAIVSALTFAAAFSASDAAAQKKSAKCVANFQEACMKQCAARGGQVRLCPQYCTNRGKELGC